MFQHTAARRRLAISTHSHLHSQKFQHTAARRRLEQQRHYSSGNGGFNTQPPEGGWAQNRCLPYPSERFQHTAARRRLVCKILRYAYVCLFQHTAARRRLATISAW